MTTFDSLTDDVTMHLIGFTNSQDSSTHLTATLDGVATTVTVDNIGEISRGLLEINDELLWVDSTDTGTSTVTFAPYGRGFRGTTAASHAIGDRVISNPAFPRTLVQKAINEAILAVFPRLYGVAQTTFTISAGITTYALPAEAESVQLASVEGVGPTAEWFPLTRWRVDTAADTTAWPTGKTISLYEAVPPGQTVNIKYAKTPTALSSGADVFTTVTGLPESSLDVIRLGATYRLIAMGDTSHLIGVSSEASFNNRHSFPTSAAQLSRSLLQQYELRINEESQRLHRLNPIRVHYTR